MKSILRVLAIWGLIALPALAQTSISQLPAGTTPTGTEVFPAVQSAATVKLRINQIPAAALANGASGSGAICLITSCALVTPNIGAATATTVNKVTITPPASGATLTIANGKTATFNNSLIFTGTDSSSVAFGTGGTVAYSSSGTWTPLDASGASLSLTVSSATYSTSGGITCQTANITYPSTANTSTAQISGIPHTPTFTTTYYGAANISATNFLGAVTENSTSGRLSFGIQSSTGSGGMSFGSAQNNELSTKNIVSEICTF